MQFESNNRAIYLQIVQRVCDLIVAGNYREEERLPSVREFAAEIEVNPNTVMRSYEKLTDKGLIYNKRGIGFFVSPGARDKILAERGNELLHSKLMPIFETLMHLNITPEKLRDIYADFLKSKKEEK